MKKQLTLPGFPEEEPPDPISKDVARRLGGMSAGCDGDPDPEAEVIVIGLAPPERTW
jgi:hypothetical protein